MKLLFRGKSVKNNKWVYGAYMRQGYTNFIIPRVNKNGYAKCIVVYIDTVSKFVTESNNEAFYEGDILSYNQGKDYGVIEYNEDYKDYLIYMQSKVYYKLESIDKFKIIGNKWDNKELFEKIIGED